MKHIFLLLLLLVGLSVNSQNLLKGGGVKTDTLSLNRLAQSGATSGQVLAWNGTAWTPTTSASSVNLDQAYNQFGATASKVNIDAAEGQTGGLEFESTGSNNHIIFDLAGSGDFIVQDTGASAFRVLQNGYASFGTAAPSTFQRLLINEAATAAITTAVTIDNNTEPVDGAGVKMAMALGSNVKAESQISDPVGGYTLAWDFNLLINSVMTSMISLNADKESVRFNRAIESEIENLTLATEQITGSRSVSYVPSSASTTILYLPEIVTGVPSTNQVSVGYVLDLIVDNSSTISLQTTGGSDEILRDGVSGKTSVISVVGGTGYVKRFIAVGANVWSMK
jgi:hypothetical protein